MRELVLTGQKECWPQNEDYAIFLGPWCFTNNHRQFQDQRKFLLAPSPWKSHKDTLDASLYIDSLIDRIIPPFSALMNGFHRTEYSEQFWKIYSILWLMYWLGHCYDRYMRLKCIQQNSNEQLRVKILCHNSHYVKDAWAYMENMMQGHFSNLVLMSDIIRNGQFSFIVQEVSAIPSNTCAKSKDQSLTNTLKRYAEQVMKTIENCLNFPIHLGTIYGVTMLDKLYFQLSLSQYMCLTKDKGELISIYGDRSNFNKQVFNFEATNEFENIIKAIFFNYVPDSMLTIFAHQDIDRRKKKIWIGYDIFISEKEGFRIAESCEHGGSWISAQHGGGYGDALSFPQGKIEYEISDGFITWGWSYKHIYDSHYHSLPSPMLSKLPKHKRKNKHHIVFVGTMDPSYLYTLHCRVTPEHQLPYLENKMNFLLALNDELKSEILYRPYFQDFGIGEVAYITNGMLNPAQIINKGKLTDYFRKSKLAVIDHPATSFLQAFAMNVPTLLFWNPEHFPLYGEAEPYFDKLCSAGILFYSPEAAARKVNEIWDDVQNWWCQPDIQKAKDEFCFQYARTSKYWRREWLDFLRNLSLQHMTK